MSTNQQWGDAVRKCLRKKNVSDMRATEALDVNVRSIARRLKDGLAPGARRLLVSEKIAQLCDVSPEAFENCELGVRHLNFRTWLDCERYAATRTLWVTYATTEGKSVFDWDSVSVEFDAKEYALPTLYRPAYQEAVSSLGSREQNRVRECLVRVERFEDGIRQKDALNVILGYSDYASKRAILSSELGRQLAHEELSHWHIGLDVIPHLSVGIGCQICVITSDNQTVFSRRKNNLRRGQYDVGAVEGLTPFLDKLWRMSNGDVDIVTEKWHPGKALDFSLKACFLRAIQEEFNISHEIVKEMNFFGLGYDLGYSQWNFVGNVYLEISFLDLSKGWPRAHSREENFRPVSCLFEVNSIEKLIENEIFWSSGLACLLYSLRYDCKKKGVSFKYDRPTHKKFRMKNELQYFFQDRI